MEAQVRFIDGETKSFAHAERIGVSDGSLIISGWFRTVAIIPLEEVRWARLAEKRRISQRDFKKGGVL